MGPPPPLGGGVGGWAAWTPHLPGAAGGGKNGDAKGNGGKRVLGGVPEAGPKKSGLVGTPPPRPRSEMKPGGQANPRVGE